MTSDAELCPSHGIGARVTCARCGDYFCRACTGRTRYCPHCDTDEVALARLGRTIVRAVAVTTLLLGIALTIVASKQLGWSSGITRIALEAWLCAKLAEGSRIARWLALVLLGMAGLVGLFVGGSMVLLSVFYLGAAAVLCLPAPRAFFRDPTLAARVD
jgi:hypothetical protein